MLVGNRYTSNIMYGMQFLRNNVICSNVSFFLFLYVYVRAQYIACKQSSYRQLIFVRN